MGTLRFRTVTKGSGMRDAKTVAQPQESGDPAAERPVIREMFSGLKARTYSERVSLLLAIERLP